MAKDTDVTVDDTVVETPVVAETTSKGYSCKDCPVGYCQNCGATK